MAGLAAEQALIELAERAAYDYGPDREALGAELRAKVDRVIEALERLRQSEPELALRLVAALPMLWEDTGRVEEGRRLTEEALVSAGPSGPDRAGALLAASELAFRQGDQADARVHAERAIELARTTDDRRVEALGHVALARVAYRDGDAPRIERHAQEALDVAGSDRAGRRGALHMLAWAAHTAGDLPLARRRFEESLAFRQGQGDRFGVAVEEANLGDLAAEEGDLAAAAAALDDALAVALELDSQYLIVNLLPSLAAVAAAGGDDEAAARLIGATDAWSERSGLIPDPGNWQPVLDGATARLGKRFEALRTEGRVVDPAGIAALAHAIATASAH